MAHLEGAVVISGRNMAYEGKDKESGKKAIGV